MRTGWRLVMTLRKLLQRAFNLLRDREGFSESSKLVVISDVLADQPTEAIQISGLT